MDPRSNPEESRRGSICRCVAYQPDGQLCGRRAVVMDLHRSGMVCPDHAPAAQAALAGAVRRLSDAWPTLPDEFRKLVVHLLARLPGGSESDTQADRLAHWADLTLLADLLSRLETETDVTATQWVIRTAENRRLRG